MPGVRWRKFALSDEKNRLLKPVGRTQQEAIPFQGLIQDIHLAAPCILLPARQSTFFFRLTPFHSRPDPESHQFIPGPQTVPTSLPISFSRCPFHKTFPKNRSLLPPLTEYVMTPASPEATLNIPPLSTPHHPLLHQKPTPEKSPREVSESPAPPQSAPGNPTHEVPNPLPVKSLRLPYSPPPKLKSLSFQPPARPQRFSEAPQETFFPFARKCIRPFRADSPRRATKGVPTNGPGPAHRRSR